VLGQHGADTDLTKWQRLPTAIDDVVMMVPSMPVRAQRPAIE